MIADLEGDGKKAYGALSTPLPYLEIRFLEMTLYIYNTHEKEKWQRFLDFFTKGFRRWRVIANLLKPVAIWEVSG